MQNFNKYQTGGIGAKFPAARAKPSRLTRAGQLAAFLAASMLVTPHPLSAEPRWAAPDPGQLVETSATVAAPTTKPAASAPVVMDFGDFGAEPVAPSTKPVETIRTAPATAPTTAPAVVGTLLETPESTVMLTEPALPATRPATGPTAEPTTRPSTQPAAIVDAGPAVVATVPVIAPAPATKPAEAPATGIIENMPPEGRLNLLVGRSFVVRTKGNYKRVSVTQPEIASDNEVDPNSILLTAKKAGAAQLIIWDDKEKSQVLDIMVEPDLVALTEMVKKNFPKAEITLSSANGTVVIRGRVPNLQVAEQITELLSAYGKALNFLELAGGQQVMLQVRFAEVSRSATTNLGVNFGFADGHAAQFADQQPGGAPYSLTDGVGKLSRQAGASVTLFGGGRIGSTEFDIFLSALRNNNLLRVLAEPNLSTISGKQAEFLAGGEFPIPVPQAGGGGNSAITVEYKQFGIRLTFIPVVLGDGKIRMQGTAEVSDLDYSRSVSFSGFTIPSLTKRTVTTTIELNEGQTFAVAGLLNNRVTASKQAIPLLGDIPVLGALFRSVRYERSETELVVLVTPRLVEAMNPKQVPELPGERWVYPSESDLFLRQYMGGPGADPSAVNKPAPIQFRGPYGFVPAGPSNARTGQALNAGKVTSIDVENSRGDE